MFKKIILCILLLNLSSNIASAENFYSNYTWEKNPKVYQPTFSDKKSDYVIVAEKKFWEVVYDSDGQAYVYETIHFIYHANNTKAIDLINKGYMSLRNNIEEVDLKARCITGENKVIYFNKSTIKSVDNYEGRGPFKIFAIDAVDAGCDVEILYTNKKTFTSYLYYYVQSKVPLTLFEARIISPKNLIFETKSYNGLPSFKSDLSDSTKNHLHLQHHDIVAGEVEKYANTNANYLGFVFQLAYNKNRNKSRIYTWDLISRDLYLSHFNFDRAQNKAIEKALSKIKISKEMSAEEKIRTFEAYLKNNFEINERHDNLTLLEAIENKKLSNINCVNFYVGVMKYLNIPFELAFTCQRDELKFDPKFPSYLYVKEYLLYFPEIDLYLSPLSINSRLGFPDPYLLMNEGLFLKEINLGEISSSTAKTKLIPLNDYKNSYHNIDVIINLNFDSKSADLSVKHSINGYPAYYIQPVYQYLNAEQKEEIHKNYYLTENIEGVKDFEVLGVAELDLYKKPMIVKYNVAQNDFLEHAGSKFILKAGLAIGVQSELYEDTKRKWPADAYYAHYLKRSIQFDIPAGYKITNLENLILSKICKINDKEVAVFNSSYEIHGNKVLIDIYEDYQAIEYPLSDFESFRTVINAAADFNKKTLIFEKL